ncbi:MAG: hypothetical protein K1X89_27225 [Myxococcaceae bacterium]|nr:hypothetical protein [Myxococcaceae bacterium]
MVKVLVVSMVVLGGCGQVSAGPGVEPCSISNCEGCCDGDTCRMGTELRACGFAGQACSDCGAGSCKFKECQLPPMPGSCAIPVSVGASTDLSSYGRRVATSTSCSGPSQPRGVAVKVADTIAGPIEVRFVGSDGGATPGAVHLGQCGPSLFGDSEIDLLTCDTPRWPVDAEAMARDQAVVTSDVRDGLRLELKPVAGTCEDPVHLNLDAGVAYAAFSRNGTPLHFAVELGSDGNLVVSGAEASVRADCSSPARGTAGLRRGPAILEVTGPASGPFTFSASVEALVPGDTCLLPLALGLVDGGVMLQGSTSALNPGLEGSCGGAGARDAIYRFETQQVQDLTVNVTASGAFQPVVYLRQGDCEAGAERACVPSTAGTASLSVPALPAGTYFLGVDGFAKTAGDYTLSLSLK